MKYQRSARKRFLKHERQPYQRSGETPTFQQPKQILPCQVKDFKKGKAGGAVWSSVVSEQHALAKELVRTVHKAVGGGEAVLHDVPATAIASGS